jgi:hypothetical protein
MKNLLIAGAMFATIAISPAIAQGQGGYQGSPGADTAAASSSDAKHMRKHHATNDTSGGTSSIDKSGTTQEGGGAMAGAQGQEQGAGAAAAGNTGAPRPRRPANNITAPLPFGAALFVLLDVLEIRLSNYLWAVVPSQGSPK